MDPEPNPNTAPTIDLVWQKTLGGNNFEDGKAIDLTSDGGFIVLGEAHSSDGDVAENKGDGDFWLVKLDESANIEWEKTYGGTGRDIGHYVRQTQDGGYILAGETTSEDGDITGYKGYWDWWIVKVSSTGALEWQNTLGTIQGDYARCIEPTRDGGFIAVGHMSTLSPALDIFIRVVKLSPNGNIEWEKSLGGSSIDYANAVRETDDGGYILAGGTFSDDGDVSLNKGEEDVWLVKLDSEGAILWEKTFGGSGKEEAYDIRQTSDGGFVFVAKSDSKNGDVSATQGENDYWLVKLDNQGNIKWERTLGGTQGDFPSAVIQDQEGGYVIAGLSESSDGDVSENKGSYDWWVVKVNDSGEIAWQQPLGGSGDDRAYGLVEADNGEFVIVGMVKSTDGDVSGNHGETDIWVVKVRE